MDVNAGRSNSLANSLNNSLSGIQKGFESATKHIIEISEAGLLQGRDIIEPAVALKQDEQQVKANVKAARTISETTGYVLDILA